MPQYHNHYNTQLYGDVKVTPIPTWRRIARYIVPIPFFVGNRVRFRLKIQHSQMNPYVFESFRGGAVIKRVTQANMPLDQEIIGNPISGEGDVEYILGYPTKISENQIASGVTLFTTRSYSDDRFLPAFVTILVTFVLSVVGTIIAGLFFGFITIDPAWIMRIVK